MQIIDSHVHWRPRAFFDDLARRKTHPLVERNDKGGYTYQRRDGTVRMNSGAEWCELDAHLEHMDGLGHQVEMVCTQGTFSFHFSDIPAAEGRDSAMAYNQVMADAQRAHPGRVRASAAVPLSNVDMAIEVLDHAINDLGLIGVDLPGKIGDEGEIDAEYLEPFYDRVEALGVPVILHPSDSVFKDMLGGYGGAMYMSLGRVIDLSVVAYRLVLSGIMERHPALKVFLSHTGGALPYQAGRMDKNSKAARLPLPPSEYLKRMYTDTVSPQSLGMKFAIDFYGIDHVMYGTDYPCWEPAEALKFLDELGLSAEDQDKIFRTNARRILGLGDGVASQARFGAEIRL
jgi:aminocarboxymuconate-semialdehyde decarboxylase